MNLYEKIDAIFATDMQEKPEWVDELLSELKEVKKLLLNQKEEARRRKELYQFISKLRVMMRANINRNFYPEIKYKNRRLGIDFRGYLYDKETQKTLPTSEAFEIYENLYRHKLIKI